MQKYPPLANLKLKEDVFSRSLTLLFHLREAKMYEQHKNLLVRQEIVAKIKDDSYRKLIIVLTLTGAVFIFLRR